MRVRAMAILIALLFISGCASAESNINRMTGSLSTQSSKVDSYRDGDTEQFYGYNEVNPDQAMNMPDQNYLLLYHNTGETAFKEKLLKYRESDGSLPIYKVDTDKYGVDKPNCLYHVNREGEIYNVVYVWYDASEIKELPIKEKSGGDWSSELKVILTVIIIAATVKSIKFVVSSIAKVAILIMILTIIYVILTSF